MPTTFGLHEGVRAVDGAVHVALGGEVHHDVGREGVERPGHGRLVEDVRLQERVARVVGDGREGVEISGVGQLVDDEDVVVRLPDQAAHDRRSDEAGAAGDEDALAHGVLPSAPPLQAPRRRLASASKSISSATSASICDRGTMFGPSEGARSGRLVGFDEDAGDAHRYRGAGEDRHELALAAGGRAPGRRAAGPNGSRRRSPGAPVVCAMIGSARMSETRVL